MSSFVFAFNALTPLLLLGLLGYILRRKGLLSDGFIDHLNRYIFIIALPVLIFVTMANMDDFSYLNWHVVWFTVVMMVVVTVLGFVFLLFWSTSQRNKPVLLQAFFRGNFVIIGVPLALRLGGVEALGIIVVLNAFMIPLSNIFSVLTFRLWKKDVMQSRENVTELIKETFINPIMIAIYLGVLVVFVNEPWVFLMERVVVIPETLELISSTAIPMALIAVGGQFRFKRARFFVLPISVGVVGRLIVVPLFVLTVAVALSGWIDFSYAWAALIALFASPVAVASVSVTKGLDGDDELASQLVLWSTAIAMVTLFFIVVIFRAIGFL